MVLSRLGTALFVPVFLAILAVGCAENGAVDPPPRSVELSPLTLASALLAQARSDSLALGLALALGDPAVRTRLRDNLRDSPFPLHALHLGSYLRGTDGAVIGVKAAAALGIGLEAFISMSESGPELELVMPRVLDRTTWDGGEELDVAATQVSYKLRREAGRVSEAGYDVRGNASSVGTFVYSPRPYVIVRPAELKFPAEPERLRAEAPKRAWNTVATRSEERALMRQRGKERVAKEKSLSLGSPTVSFTLELCDPMTAIIECPTEGGGGGGGFGPQVGGGGATLSAEMTQTYCYGISPALDATTDRDKDGIRDACEEALASRLAPLLNIGNEEQYPARQPYWAASRHPDRPNNVQIIYALAYLRDGGYLLWGSAHQGDSEFIILEVKNVSASKWGLIEATLSVHFNSEESLEWFITGIHSGTDSYYWDDLDYPQGPFPRIWSALDKHANYRNRATCEAGGGTQDSCHGDYVGTQIPAPASRNLGNFYNLPLGTRNPITQLIDCTLWEGPSPLYPGRLIDADFGYRTGEECFWREINNTKFSGWDPIKPDDATPYRRIFEIFEF